MTFYISICEDMAALKASGAVSEESPYRGMIDGRSGAHVQYSADGTKSMVVLTDLTGLEPLEQLAYITVAPVESFFDHMAQQVIDGVPQFEDVQNRDDDGEFTEGFHSEPVMETVLADPDLRALYDSIYDQSEITDEMGNTHTPSKFFAIPGGHDVSHIL